MDLMEVDHRLPETTGFGTQEFLQLVGQHIHRWSHAKISLGRPESLLPQPLESPAPNLEKLELMMMMNEATTSIDLFAGLAPKLHSVNLHRIAVRNWDSPIFKGLRSLTIVGPPLIPPSLEQIMCMIRGSPLLEHLSLVYIREHGRTSLEDEGKPVVLHHLRSLELNALPPPVLAILIRNIRIPTTCSVAIGCTYTDTPNHFTLGQSLTHILPAINSLLRHSKRISLYLGASRLICNALTNTIQSSFRLHVKGMDSVLPLAWVSDALRETLQGLPIKVELESDFDPAEEVTSQLWRMESLEELEVAEDIQDTEWLFEALTQPVVTDTKATWRLPRLLNLHLQTTHINPFSALRMVESRYGVSPGPLDAVRPVPFHRLKFRELPDNVAAEIRRIVGRKTLVVGDNWESDDGADEMEEDEGQESGEE